MLKCKIGALVGALAISAVSTSGQTVPSAHQANLRAQLGIEFSAFQTDVDLHPWEYGIGAFADINVWRSIGIELEARSIQFNEQRNVRQDIASAGLRFVVPTRRLSSRGLYPYVKAMGGHGSADFPMGTYGASPLRQHDTFTTMTLGGGADYKLSPRLVLRADYEYQFWFDYGRGIEPGLGTASPTGVSVGVAYRF
jgi:opacity protein-like surface antigen